MRSLVVFCLFLSISQHASAIVVASTLPASRSVQTGSVAGIFATMINGGPGTATNCRVELGSAITADFYYQITDPVTNAPLGQRDTPVDIVAGQAQSFILGITPNAAINSSDISFSFICDNDGPAPIFQGLNTLLLSASETPVADVIALAATVSGDGIVDMPLDNQFGFFSVATINLGSTATVRVSTNTTGSGVSNALVCETNPVTAVCITDLLPEIETVVMAGSTPTFSVFISSENAVIFDPANNRLNVTFSEGGLVRGATSVAIKGGGASNPGGGSTQPVDPALSAFTADVSEPIVQSRCIACHISGGVAGNTTLLFTAAAGDSAHETNNYSTFETYIATVPDGASRILDKVRGVAHGGGAQLTSGSDDFINLSAFLDLLGNSGSGGGSTPPAGASLFTNIDMGSNTDTLWRASIILSGLAPSDADMTEVRNGDDSMLRNKLRSLMQGEGFHAFLIEGSNDQLLTDKFVSERIFDTFDAKFVNYTNLSYELSAMAESTDDFTPEYMWQSRHDFGQARAPLELIAYVTENDLAYTEILTADYMMANPWTNDSIGGSASFGDPRNVREFKPAVIGAYYRDDDSKIVDFEDDIGPRVIDAGNLITDYPHAGILNSPAFLRRYPSTATNRNRARARWTFQHFLGVDIEKSASRTTDPVALADTNNPTLNNENCTVCHSVMDPVAGAFQNYGNTGLYRDQFGGRDSLPDLYKFPHSGSDSLYREGDSWFRDMRTPGFEGAVAPDSKNSLQWLAAQIVEDPRFAKATVEFWWPAIMGTEVLIVPEEASDAGFDQQLLAYEEQQAVIAALASGFTQGTSTRGSYNMKDLLVEMVMTSWFRASATDAADAAQTPALADAGAGRLLTPEQLTRKTKAVTGFTWGNFYDDFLQTTNSNLSDRYRLYYGGIDSDGIEKRAEDMTTLMSAVAQSHALESACPIVMHEYLSLDLNRRLFSGVDRHVTPSLEATARFSVAGTSFAQRSSYNLTADLRPGTNTIRIYFANDFHDNSTGQSRDLLVDSVVVRNSTGAEIARYELENIDSIDGASAECGHPAFNSETNSQDHFNIFANCAVTLPLILDVDTNVNIEVVAWGNQAGSEVVALQVSIDAQNASDGLAAGAQTIKQQLVRLHERMLGEQLAIDSTEINRSYQLLVDTWLGKQNSETSNQFPGDNVCAWWQDHEFFDDFLETPHIVREDGYPEFNHEAIQVFLESRDTGDSTHMLKTWVVMIVYLMTDYRYLYI